MNEKRNKSRLPSVDKVVFISFLVDISDLLINVVIAILSGSVVMLAQAMQGGSDLVSTTLLLIGVHRSKKKNEKTYPFGNGRELYFWNMIAAMIMFGITATMSVYFGVQRVNNPQPIDNVWLSLFILFFALTTNGYSFWLSTQRLLNGKDINNYFRIIKNSPFIETKTVFLKDLMGTSAAFIGIIAMIFYLITGDIRYDGLGAIFIGVTLAILSILLLDGIRQMIVGRRASDSTEKKIVHIAQKMPEVESVVDLKTMYIGPNKMLVNIEIHVVDKLTTTKIEKLIDKIEKEIKESIPAAAFIQIELETPR